jgi:hypothetical protein
MTGRQIEQLCSNPPPQIEERCVEGMECESEEDEPERVFQVRRHRGLEPVPLGGRHYLLRMDPVVRGMAAELNKAKNVLSMQAAASALFDRLSERDIPVPPPVLAVLRQLNADGKRALVLRLLESPDTRSLGNREVACRCGCSDGLVRSVRAELSAHGAQMPDTITVQRGGTRYAMRRSRKAVDDAP